MPRVKRLAAGAPTGSSCRTTAADWKAADPALLATMLGQLHLIRAFEETVLELAGEGLVHGPAHSSIGQEGGAVGSIVALRSTDAGQRLAPRPPPVPRQGAHPRRPRACSTSADARDRRRSREVLQRTLAEILGLAQGYCSGRGGSMHLQWLEAGALGTNAIVGGGVPMAAGQRLGAEARRHRRDVTVTYFGDGAANIGSVLETLNLAVGLEAAALLLHREQPLRRLHHRRGGHRRAAAVGARPRLRHPRLAGRRHGPARRAPGDGARRSSSMRAGDGPGRHRGRASTASSTRTARSPAARSATAPRRRRRAWRARDPLRPRRAPR